MIIYLPEFDLYADPTVATGSFDALPASLADKPVLRVGSKATTVARTPALQGGTEHGRSLTERGDGPGGRDDRRPQLDRGERPGCDRGARA